MIAIIPDLYRIAYNLEQKHTVELSSAYYLHLVVQYPQLFHLKIAVSKAYHPTKNIPSLETA